MRLRRARPRDGRRVAGIPSATCSAAPVLTALLAGVLTACGGPVQPSAGPHGVEPGSGVHILPDGSWALQGPEGEVRVTGRPSSVLAVVLRVDPACPSARVALGSTQRRVRGGTDVLTGVRVGASGEARVPVRVTPEGCTPSDGPAAVLSRPLRALAGPGGAPWTLPVQGFSRPDESVIGLGWWLQQREGVVEVRGEPGDEVALTVAVTPPPCQPEVVVELGSETHTVSVPRWVVQRVRVGPDGVTRLTVRTPGPACPSGLEAGDVFVHVVIQTTVVR